MPQFEYEALSADGQITTGTTIGSSVPSVVADFRSRGFTITKIQQAHNPADPIPSSFSNAGPLSVASPYSNPGQPAHAPVSYEYAAPAPAPGPAPQIINQPTNGSEEFGEEYYKRNFFATNIWGPTLGKVSLTNLQFFFQQLGTMTNAGVPLVQSLDTLGTNNRDPKLKTIIFEMRDAATIGHTVTSPMQRYPEVFSPLMISMVRAGEEGGFFDGALRQVADYISQEIQLRNLYRRTTAYPKLVLAASIAIIGGANMIISTIGKGSTIAAPLNSITTWFFLAPILIGLFLFFRIGLSIPAIRYHWDSFVRWIPFVGTTMEGFAMAKFGRALGALHAAGVNTPKAIRLSADSTGNEYVRAHLHPVSTKLESGNSLAQCLRETGVVSPLVLDMVATGETTGNLELMLTKLSEFYEDESKTKAVQMGQFTGVVALTIAAIYVGYVVFSFFTGYGQAVSNVANEASNASN